jgi:drug/metabolite transporter (DMT)-like permease
MNKTFAPPSLTLAGFLITLTGTILFSTKAIIVKTAFANADADALTLLTLRMLFSIPFYIVAAWYMSSREGNVKMTRKEWIYTLLLGLTGYYLSSLFDFLGLQYISAGLERLILFLYPTFAVLLNTYILKQKLYQNQKWALAITYAGIAVAYFGELKMEGHNADYYWGSFLVFLCAVTYSFYIVGSSRVIPKVGATKFTAYAMLAATAGIFVHYSFSNGFSALAQNGHLWRYGLLLAVIATVIPSFLLSDGLRRIGANNAAIVSSIGPVSTILQAHYFLGEKIFAAQVVGTVLVVIGVLMLSWKISK